MFLFINKIFISFIFNNSGNNIVSTLQPLPPTETYIILYKKATSKTRDSYWNQSGRYVLCLISLCLFNIPVPFACELENVRIVRMRWKFDSLRNCITSQFWPHCKSNRQCHSPNILIITRWYFLTKYVARSISVDSHIMKEKDFFSRQINPRPNIFLTLFLKYL